MASVTTAGKEKKSKVSKIKFFISRVEKLFKEKLGLKNIGKKFRVLFEENCTSEKNYRQIFKKISIFIRKIVKKSLQKSLRILKEKIQNFNNFMRKMVEFFQSCGHFVI